MLNTSFAVQRALRSLLPGWQALLPRALWCGMLACSASLVTPAVAQTEEPPCGSLLNGYGPYDYLLQKDKLPIVEQHHFTFGVATLSQGHTSIQLGSDLDYTLRVFPNHHRALLAMERLGQRLQTAQPPGAGYPVECYFERALRFRPHDNTARLLYANYLYQNRREGEAMAQMEAVDTEAEADGLTHYNMGLIYLEQKQYTLAQDQARKAQAMGIDTQALRHRLEQLGYAP